MWSVLIGMLGPIMKWVGGIVYDLLKTATLAPDTKKAEISDGPIKTGFSGVTSDDIRRKHGWVLKRKN